TRPSPLPVPRLPCGCRPAACPRPSFWALLPATSPARRRVTAAHRPAARLAHTLRLWEAMSSVNCRTCTGHAGRRREGHLDQHGTGRVGKSEPFDVAVGFWWRFSRYELQAGCIRPASSATLEWYDPWAAYRDSRERGAATQTLPYQSLLDLLH